MATREQVYSPLDTREQDVNRALARVYSLNWEVIAYTAILVLAIVTRFVDLGARVMSHDESLHTYYSWRLYEFGEFSHTPLMHGPVIFHANALFYYLFGDTDFTARIYAALLGVLVVMFPLLFRRWLGRLGAVLTSAMLLISPQILYYSRYIREDIPTLFFTLVFIYGIFQYVDGRPQRQFRWLIVAAAGMLLALASKELVFMYVLIFAAYLLFFMLLRTVQDIGVHPRPAGGSHWRAPWLQAATGHVVLLALTALAAVLIGLLLRQYLLPTIWIPSDAYTVLPVFLVLYLPLAASGWLHGLFSRGRSDEGAALALVRGLSNTRSSFLVVITGTVVGAIMALTIISVLDVIKPGDVWKTSSVSSAQDQINGVNTTKEYAVETTVDTTMLMRLSTWIGLPALALIFAVVLTAVFAFPGTVPLPWREILLILLVAFLICGVLLFAERHSHVAEDTGSEPFAADVTGNGSSVDGQYDDIYIWATWGIAAVAVLFILGTRFLTDWWAVLDRQPTFDLVVVIVTLVLPWATAVPLYLGGYDLEEYSPTNATGQATLNAAITAFVPFAVVALTIGLAWNWRRWLPVTAVFLGLFAFFYTTVFSNINGTATGMVGSLGYWLAQQGVRRGSQPQYYYLLTQVPVYEFLPLIGSMFAGVAGLSALWRWRRVQVQEGRVTVDEDWNEAEALDDSAALDVDETPLAEPEVLAVPAGPDGGTGELPDDPSVVRYMPDIPRYYRPYDYDEELEQRATARDWLGELPFMPFVGFWLVLITLGLTVAGEKMPWLTTHIVVPMTFAAGWWLGRVIGGVRRESLRGGGLLVTLVVLPVGFVSLAHALVALWGDQAPFQGRDVADLAASGTWFAALLLGLAALYVVVRSIRRIGTEQMSRLVVIAGAVLLSILTVRASVRAAYIDYDYATEYLVYAHSGPAVKTVMDMVDDIATKTNEGYNMRVVYDDQSSWPFTWYFRHYTNYSYIAGEAGSVSASSLDGARVVVVGGKKVGDVRRILGDRYYEYSFIRLWWPMQDYFGLTYDRVTDVLSLDSDDIAAPYLRQGLWDIWFNRDYETFGEAQCIQEKQSRCESEAAAGATPEEQDRLRDLCKRSVVTECSGDTRFSVNNWPVSDRMYFFVDKEIAAQIWDAGIGGASVDIRSPEYPEDVAYRDIPAETILAETSVLLNPRGVAVSDDGEIYVADTDHSRIAVLDGSGNLLRTIGENTTGSSEAGLLLQPWGVALGPDGNVYVADTWNHRVQIFTPDGELLRQWGHQGVLPDDTSPDAFWGPRDIVVGADGTVYVADTGNKRVRVYTSEGEFVRDIGGSGTELGQMDEPVGLALNPVDGDLYVAESWNQRIQVFAPDGTSLRAWSVNMWFTNRESSNRPYLAISPDGSLVFATDMDDHERIVAYDLNGQVVASFDQADQLDQNILGLRSPAGLAFDDAGRLVVIDAEQATIYVFAQLDFLGGVLPVPAQPDAEATEDTGLTIDTTMAADDSLPDAPMSTAPVMDESLPAATETLTDPVATDEAVG
ncbi:flippase activity-associated protein Agl23 [Aggregatilinea lenta]|uniref:flippase activity-associated protein Agl23 n=1 Tax=Aggregatilinea lenta TaxID=913108 RepID=UPI000E5C4810|nr:flippase activity-associated protein Agl23 [Aggregatilinea lenta]